MIVATYPPPITRVLNRGYQHPVDWQELANALVDAQDFVREVSQRLDRVVPLVRRAEGATEIIERTRSLQGELDSCLAALIRVADIEDPELLPGGLERLEGSALALWQALGQLQALQGSLPSFSDHRLLNQVFALGLNLLSGEPDQEALLAAHLPDLFGFTVQLGLARERFAASHPDETAIVQALDPALESIKEATGGFALYLQGRQANDLSNALTLLDRAMGPLAACLKAMRTLEYELSTFSEDPLYERCFRALSRGEQPEARSALIALEVSHRSTVEKLKRMLARFLGHKRREQWQQRLTTCLDGCEASLAQLLAHPSLAGLTDFRDRAIGLDGLALSLHEELESPARLEGAAHFAELLELLEKVWSEGLPDRVLEEKTRQLAQSQQDYRLFLKTLADTEKAERIERCLDEQEKALEEIQAYLRDGHRDHLELAADLLFDPTRELAEIASADEPPAPELETASKTCPFCSHKNPETARSCSSCARPFLQEMTGAKQASMDLSESPQASRDPFEGLWSLLDQAQAGTSPPEQVERLLLASHATIANEISRLEETDAASEGADTCAALLEVAWELKLCLEKTVEQLREASPDLSDCKMELKELGDRLLELHQELGQRMASAAK
ncbi:hypothetical protein DYH09_00590 [bacterium CPR1]|nr:hypothetical protein [bacterium CPR1]